VIQNFIFLSTNSLLPFHATLKTSLTVLARLLKQRRPIKHLPRNHGRFIFSGFESTQLARQLNKECTQMEAQ